MKLWRTSFAYKGSKVQTWFCSGLQGNGRRNLHKTSAGPTARRTSWAVNYWSAAVGGLGTLLLQQNNKFHESVVVRRCSKCSNKHTTCKKKLIRVRTLRLTISHHPIIQLGKFVEHFQTCVEWRRRRTRAKHQVQEYGSCNIYAPHELLRTEWRHRSSLLFGSKTQELNEDCKPFQISNNKERRTSDLCPALGPTWPEQHLC
jgi:hypothetical protein